MGFEQLAELKKQLAKQAEATRKRKREAQPKSRPEAQSRSEAQPKSGSGARSGPRPEAQSRPEAQPRLRPEAQSRSEVQPKSRPEARSRSESRPEARSEPKPKPVAHSPQARRPAPPADAKPVDPVVRTIGKLQKRFPNAFPKNPAPKVALKVGIFEDLASHASELALSDAELRDAIKTWCRGTRYWACLVEDAVRVDLAGAEAGRVSVAEAARARWLEANRLAKAVSKPVS